MFRLALTVVAMSTLAACASGMQAAEAPPIAIQSVRLSAAGHMVDMRYRVVDPVRANEMLGPGIKPILIDQETGLQMGVPMTAKLGALRQTQAPQKPDHLYFVLFVNSAGVVPGSKVTAQLGDIQVANLTVE